MKDQPFPSYMSMFLIHTGCWIELKSSYLQSKKKIEKNKPLIPNAGQWDWIHSLSLRTYVTYYTWKMWEIIFFMPGNKCIELSLIPVTNIPRPRTYHCFGQSLAIFFFLMAPNLEENILLSKIKYCSFPWADNSDIFLLKLCLIWLEYVRCNLWKHCDWKNTAVSKIS